MDSMRGAFKENQAYNRHPRWFQLNRNKLSLTLDLRDARDHEAFCDLVKISDIVVESSRAGVLESLGIGYPVLRKIRPDIILVSMSACGHTGPESSYGGYGGGIEAISGVQVLTAYNKGEKPHRIKEVDVTNGLMGACAIITALLYRQRSGRGQFVDLSQIEASTMTLAGEHLLEYSMNGLQTLPLGNRHCHYAPQGCYRCKGNDKWVTLVVRTEEEWRALCEVMGDAGLVHDPRFSSAHARASAHDELDPIIEHWTQEHSHIQAMELLQKAGVCAGAVLNVAELAMDADIRENYLECLEEGETKLPFPGFSFNLSTVSPEIRRKGPLLGQDNEYVLCELLGRPRADLKPLSEDQIGTAYDIETLC